MMDSIEQIPVLRERLREWRRAGQRIALVPTMGALHEGHLALVRAALTQAERVVVSIFVNPLQFGPGEDFSRYPRPLARDTELLAATGAHLLFAPAEQELYPNGRERVTRVEVPELSDILCGAHRPGHFVGVATVVTKLLNIVQPEVALFGEKDYQQLLVIQRLVADLDVPVTIVGVPTVREADGLALSSRNEYLSPAERAIAPWLYRTLEQVAAAVRAGVPFAQAEREAESALRARGFRPDYVSVRRAVDLARPAPDERALIVLAAAQLGAARLIDNLKITRS